MQNKTIFSLMNRRQVTEIVILLRKIKSRTKLSYLVS